MNLAEALLAADAGKVKSKRTKDIEIKRLSEMMGVPFIIHLKQIPNRRVREIQDRAIVIKGKDTKTDQYALYMGLICDGIENKEFDNKEVLKHFGAATRKELFDVLFNAGEIQDIAEEISKLCGFGGKSFDDEAEEVKN
jgi:hypothetical protein